MMITIIIVKNMVWTCCAKPWILIITIGAVNGPITEVLQTFKIIFCISNQFSPELKCISSPLGIGRVQKLGTGCLFIITSFFLSDLPHLSPGAEDGDACQGETRQPAARFESINISSLRFLYWLIVFQMSIYIHIYMTRTLPHFFVSTSFVVELDKSDK